MNQKIAGKNKKGVALSPTHVRQQKRAALKKMYGMWKNRQPDSIKELEKMRREWD